MPNVNVVVKTKVDVRQLDKRGERMSPGRITVVPDKAANGQLSQYTSQTTHGWSGAGVCTTSGHVVGIHLMGGTGDANYFLPVRDFKERTAVTPPTPFIPKN